MALDLSNIEKMDTAGAWLIDRLVSVFEKKGVEIRLQGQSEIASILLDAVGEAVRREPESGPVAAAQHHHSRAGGGRPARL